MHKKKSIYITIVFLFILAVFCVTVSYLIINVKFSGAATIHKNYSGIVFNNTYMEYDSNCSIKMNDEEKFIHINIPNLNEIQSNNSFLVDITNIGNIDKQVYTSITNYSSNVDEDNILIDLILDNGSIIKGGETKRVRINVKYLNEKKSNEIPKLSFNVNFNFE